MQSLTWYIRRLSQMSSREIVWRVKSSGMDIVDRGLLGLRQRQRPISAIIESGQTQNIIGFKTTDLPPCLPNAPKPMDMESQWHDRVVKTADNIVQHRISFFDLENHFFGDPIDWNRDHKSEIPAPLTFSPWIDYRDFRITGDCKFVWELNRHHHLVVLARAWRVTEYPRYAQAVAEQLESWLDQNPFGLGMNWRSPLELGVRLINWVWTADLLREAGIFQGRFRDRFLQSVHQHLWEISRKFSQGSSVGNHLVGEAAGVFVAASYFPFLKNASRQAAQSWEILNDEIIHQTYRDGGGLEQALGYHSFILKFFLIAGWVAERTGRPFPPEYWARLEKMFEFESAFCEGGENVPMFGDADDGYVLDLGSRFGDFREMLAVAAVLCRRPEFKNRAGQFSEPAFWFLGPQGRRQFDEIPIQPSGFFSRALPESGYYLLQGGDPESSDAVSVVFDCGRQGLEPMAGHGHADALSFTLRLLGRDILVDPGTYDYFTYPRWRSYFRSTRAHNTITIDKQDQSEMSGLFLWSKKANARLLSWTPADQGGSVIAEHDGYTRLTDPVIHRRTLELDRNRGKLIVKDDIISRGPHGIDIHFHVSEHCRVRPVSSNEFEIDFGLGIVKMIMDKRLSWRVLIGSEEPIGGWVSRRYHHKVVATTLTGYMTARGETTLVSELDFGTLPRNKGQVDRHG